MKFYKLIFGVLCLSLMAFTPLKNTESSKYKCMIQLKNYEGEGAYISISLLNANDEYVETLYVQGDDDEWYSTIINWWEFQEEQNTNIDAITGATVSGGGRTINIIEIDDDKINSGHKIRFESAVENQEYYKDDVAFELTSETVNGKFEGTGYIRYVRIIPN